MFIVRYYEQFILISIYVFFSYHFCLFSHSLLCLSSSQTSAQHEALNQVNQQQGEQIAELQKIISEMRAGPAQQLTFPAAASFSQPGTYILFYFV